MKTFLSPRRRVSFGPFAVVLRLSQGRGERCADRASSGRLAVGALLAVLVLLSAGCASNGPTTSVAIGGTPPTGAATPLPGLTVFGDGLAPGWFDSSWNSAVDLDVVAPVYAGTRALGLTVTKPWGGLYLRKQGGVDPAGYEVLRFAALAAVTTGPAPGYAVWLVDPSGRQLSPPRSLDLYGGQPSDRAWRLYSVPLADLGVDGAIGGIVVQDARGAAEPPLFLDEIGFSAAPAESAATPLVTPTRATPTPAPVTPRPVASPSPIASPSPSPSPTPAPVAPTPAIATATSRPGAAPLAIYGDGLAAGWQNVSFGVVVDFAAAGQVYSGNRAIAVRFTQPFGAVVLRRRTPIDLAAYGSLTFAARAAAPGAQLEVRLADAAGTPIGAAVALDGYGGQPTPGGWTVYRIPIGAFGAGAQPVAEIVVQATIGAGEPALYLDAIQLQ